MFGELAGFTQPSVATFSEGVGLPASGEALSVNLVSEGLFLVGAAAVPAAPSVFPSAVLPTDAPSLGDCRSEASPPAVLYHWHWKSRFQISTGSGSAALASVSGCSVAFAASAWKGRWENIIDVNLHLSIYFTRRIGSLVWCKTRKHTFSRLCGSQGSKSIQLSVFVSVAVFPHSFLTE